MRESVIVRRVLNYLNTLPHTVAFKSHGSQFQTGWPDIVGCSRGRAFALEVKVPGRQATALQAMILERWRKAGAITGVVHGMAEVEVLINLIDGGVNEQH